MENLLTKNISYSSLRETFKEDETEIQNFIKTIQSPELRDRIIDEAKQFYADCFNIEVSDIWYGDISSRYAECENPFPFSHVIGSIDLGCANIDMDKLIYCKGINSTGVCTFKNLETIDGVGNFNGTHFTTSSIRELPKLKHAPYLYCCNSNLTILNLEEAVKVNLTKSKVKKLNLRVVTEELSVAFSEIKDISSLESVGKFNCRNTNIEIVNPNLKIHGDLICDNSNFEEKRQEIHEI